MQIWIKKFELSPIEFNWTQEYNQAWLLMTLFVMASLWLYWPLFDWVEFNVPSVCCILANTEDKPATWTKNHLLMRCRKSGIAHNMISKSRPTSANSNLNPMKCKHWEAKKQYALNHPYHYFKSISRYRFMNNWIQRYTLVDHGRRLSTPRIPCVIHHIIQFLLLCAALTFVIHLIGYII